MTLGSLCWTEEGHTRDRDLRLLSSVGQETSWSQRLSAFLRSQPPVPALMPERGRGLFSCLLGPCFRVWERVVADSRQIRSRPL